MKELNTMSSAWQEFKDMTIPKTAGKDQLKDMEEAFYAGAISLSKLQWKAADTGISETDAMAIVNNLYEELSQFSKRVLNDEQ